MLKLGLTNITNEPMAIHTALGIVILPPGMKTAVAAEGAVGDLRYMRVLSMDYAQEETDIAKAAPHD